jgi:hypothetical protein
MRPPDRYLFIVRRRVGFDVASAHLLTLSLAIEDRVAAAIGIREYLDEGISIDLFHEEPDLGHGHSRHLFVIDPTLPILLVELARNSVGPSFRSGVPPEHLKTWTCAWRQAPVIFKYLPTTIELDAAARPRIHVKLDGSWSIDPGTGIEVEAEIKAKHTIHMTHGGKSLRCGCGYLPPPGVDADDALTVHLAAVRIVGAATVG